MLTSYGVRFHGYDATIVCMCVCFSLATQSRSLINRQNYDCCEWIWLLLWPIDGADRNWAGQQPKRWQRGANSSCGVQPWESLDAILFRDQQAQHLQNLWVDLDGCSWSEQICWEETVGHRSGFSSISLSVHTFLATKQLGEIMTQVTSLYRVYGYVFFRISTFLL